MITLHHLNSSRSQRILWLLEEMELPYQIKYYQRSPSSMLAPDELKKIHPLGKSPVINDDQQVIAESAVIIEYLLNRYDQDFKFKPTLDSPEWPNYLYWLHYAEGSLMSVLMVQFMFSRLAHPPVPLLIRPIGQAINQGIKKNYLNREIKKHADFIEQHLKQHRWFAGEHFSAADIQMGFPLEVLLSRGIEHQAHYPTIMRYLDTVHQRPAYQRAQQKGGEFNILG